MPIAAGSTEQEIRTDVNILSIIFARVYTIDSYFVYYIVFTRENIGNMTSK